MALPNPLLAFKLINQGDTWRYFRGTSFPSGWTTNGFDDSGWLTGPSGFGYGDSDDATVLSDMQNSYVTVFTRREFIVTNPTALVAMTLGADYDDGFVAYINGVEVTRRNVISNTIDSATLAAGNHEAVAGGGGPKENIAITNNLAALLRPGDPSTNVIAVSGHNVSSGSSDLSLIIDLDVSTNLSLTRGPYIQLPRTNATTIVWLTDAAADSAVDYGLDTSYSDGTVSDSTSTTVHVIHLPGLSLGTNYYYRVRSGGVTLSSNVFFRTPRLSGQPWRTAIIGDFGTFTSGMSNIANQVNARDFDLFLTVGDNIYNVGQRDGYDPYWFIPYAPTMRRVPCMPVLGNHDIGTENGQPFVDYFYLPTNGPASYLEKNYSFDYANAHFCAVDSNPFDLLQQSAINAIKTWVSNDLATTTQQWKFVYFHHPPYTSVGGHNDNERVKTNLMPIVESLGVDVVFVGHNHFYERINAINGVYHIISGGSGAGLNTVSTIKPYSNVIVYNIHSFALFEINGPKFTLWGINATNGTFDTFSLDKSVPFKIDGLLDANQWGRSTNSLILNAAIRGNFLYLATQDAGEGSDHCIYLNNILTTNRSANWAKSGQIMQWSAFLADENDNGFVRWYGSNEQQLTNDAVYRAMTSGLNNNGFSSNGVLEGTIDIATHFGAFPQTLYVAGAPYATTNGGALVTIAQVPAGNGNGNIESNEFLTLNTRDIALDLPIANAGSNFSIEAGMTATLNGSASTASSGLPLNYNWTQTSGDAVTLLSSNTAVASFVATNAGSRAFQLEVNDTRFASNATVTVTVTALTDTDGDGLSDAEETTGQDNVLTLANPNGQVTDPDAADTDGDVASDGDEALAGTDPNSAASTFRVTKASGPGGGGFNLEWTSVTGKTYVVDYRNDFANTWSPLTNIAATTTLTNVTDGASVGPPQRFYRVRVLP